MPWLQVKAEGRATHALGIGDAGRARRPQNGMIACTMPLESMWIGNLILGLSMQEPHRDVPPDKVPPPKHPPDVIPFDPDEEPDFPPGGPPIKDPQPDPEPPPAA